MSAKQPTFKIKPANKDVTVLDPETRKPLEAKGETKPRNEYWLRRLADKSVIEVTTAKK